MVLVKIICWAIMFMTRLGFLLGISIAMMYSPLRHCSEKERCVYGRGLMTRQNTM